MFWCENQILSADGVYIGGERGEWNSHEGGESTAAEPVCFVAIIIF